MESNSEEKDTKETNGPSLWLAVGLSVLVFLLWSVNLFISFSHPYDARGTFGDMFGAVNALFTGLAFAAVIYAIFLQKHEVRLLKSELAGTKRMMKEQQVAAAEQMELQSKQQFESTFFSLLRIFCDLVESIDLRSNGKVTAQGKDVFPIFLQRMKRHKPFKDAAQYPSVSRTTWAEDSYANFYKGANAELGHYFRTLYNLFKFVDNADIAEKRFYTNLIRAQLSDSEALLLFLNGLSPQGKKFRGYLENYAVLKNVDKKDTLFRHAKGKETYSPSAFGE